MKTYLVTGAAGFIGSHCVDRLLAWGHRVIGVDNLRTGHLRNLKQALTSPNFQFLRLDVADEEALIAIFRQYRLAGLLHLAALVSVPESFKETALNFRTNLAATDILARLCIDFQCPRIVFASSAAVYGNSDLLPNEETAEPHPQSPYAAAKLASEVMLLAYAETHGLEAVCFRYFNVYGPRQDPSSPYSGVLSIFAECFKAGLPVTVYGDGEQTRDFISVSDVAAANCRVLTAATIVNGRYNLCTARAVSLNRILDIFRQSYPDAPPTRYAPSRVGDIRHSLGSPRRLLETMGIGTQVSFDQGLSDLIASDGKKVAVAKHRPIAILFAT